MNYGNCIINSSYFSNNFGEYCTIRTLDSLKVYDSLFLNNTCAIYCSDAIIENSSFCENYIDDEFGEGAAIHSIGIIFINDCEFINNSATYGGAVSISSTVYEDPGFSIMKNYSCINNSYFETNYGLYGGSVYSCANLIVNNTYFVENYGDYAGAMHINSGDIKIVNSDFVENDFGAIVLTVVKTYTGDILNVNLTIDGKSYKNAVNLNNEFKQISLITVKVNNVVTNYGKNAYLNIKLNHMYNKEPVESFSLKVKIGSKTYNVIVLNGSATLKVPKLNVGTYKVVISSNYGFLKVSKNS